MNCRSRGDFLTLRAQIILSGGTSHTPRIASNLVALFPPSTKILSPSTLPTAINPSDLAARGAAIQASLIQDFDLEDITQSAHPMVTATPHLKHAIGVLVVSESIDRGIFVPLLAAETAVPARRSANFATPKEGGDVIIKVCEGLRDIKVTKPEPKNANGKASKTGERADEDSDEDTSSEEEEETREKIWKSGNILAEAAIKGVKKGAKVEVMVNVGADLGVQITAREVGGKGGVRGSLNKASVKENGSA